MPTSNSTSAVPTDKESGEICVIGAGPSGLASVRALLDAGVAVDCFERAAGIGGLWRHNVGSERTAAYASVTTNVSRGRMDFPSFPIPSAFGEFIHNTDVLRYLEMFAHAFDLERHIELSTEVQTVAPRDDGLWSVQLADGRERAYRGVIVATGMFWEPKWPEFPGETSVPITHCLDYDRPEPFRGKRVLLVGLGQSAAEIAAEIAPLAKRVDIAVRRAPHVIPRHVMGKPVDYLDLPFPNRWIPWPLAQFMFALEVRIQRGPPERYGLPKPDHRMLEAMIPVFSTKLLDALRRGAVGIRPHVIEVLDERVEFADGSREPYDAIMCTTGYRLSFPFLSPGLVTIDGRRFPLYRRVVAPDAPDGLYFIGMGEPISGIFRVIEAQALWLADVVANGLPLPPRSEMRHAISRAERRTRRRFPDDDPESIRCDHFAYIRTLEKDRKSARCVVPRPIAKAASAALNHARF